MILRHFPHVPHWVRAGAIATLALIALFTFFGLEARHFIDSSKESHLDSLASQQSMAMKDELINNQIYAIKLRAEDLLQNHAELVSHLGIYRSNGETIFESGNSILLAKLRMGENTALVSTQRPIVFGGEKLGTIIIGATSTTFDFKLGFGLFLGTLIILFGTLYSFGKWTTRNGRAMTKFISEELPASLDHWEKFVLGEIDVTGLPGQERKEAQALLSRLLKLGHSLRKSFANYKLQINAARIEAKSLLDLTSIRSRRTEISVTDLTPGLDRLYRAVDDSKSRDDSI